MRIEELKGRCGAVTAGHGTHYRTVIEVTRGLIATTWERVMSMACRAYPDC